MSEYARAMAKEQERLEKARKRNAAEALANGGGDDDDDGDGGRISHLPPHPSHPPWKKYTRKGFPSLRYMVYV